LPIENNGSVVIYNRVIRPYFLKHQDKIGNVLDNLAGSGKEN